MSDDFKSVGVEAVESNTTTSGNNVRVLDEKPNGELTKDNFSIHTGDEEVQQLAEDMEGRLGKQLGVSEHDIEFMHNIIRSMTIEEAREILEKALVDHKHDRNMAQETLDTIKDLLYNTDSEKAQFDIVEREFAMKAEAALIHYHSPYPEVRAVTDPYDDPDMIVETFRAYVIGTIGVIIGTGVNQFFEPHNPPVIVPATLFQLLALPCGWFASKFLPDWGFTIRGTRYTLNPGPWTYKEQMLCTIMFGITASVPYVDSQIMVQKMHMYYDNQWANAGFQFLLTLSTQFLGFGIAGLLRNILVYSPVNLWMFNFPTLALNRSLMQPETNDKVHGWGIKRYSFFGIVFVGVFFYEWLPNYLMNFLQTFNWMTWIAPDNFNLAAITGTVSGLGINPIPTFDWNVISALNNPLITPFFATANMMFGCIIGGAVLIPAIYYSNMYNTAYLPINSAGIFTNTGEPYDVLQVLTDNVLDLDKYQQYSPPYYTASNLVLYGTFFAAYTSVFVRSLLYDWRIMYQGYVDIFWLIMGRGKGIHRYNDAHSRMMQKYPETPTWWFLVIMLISLALAIACVEGYKETKTPVWGIFFALILGVIFLVPIGNLYAQTNNLFSLNVLTELVAGYALPGHGTAMMIIKAFGLNINLQAIYFMQDLKLGHYAKVPPRATFRAQLWASLIASLVMIGVVNWTMSNVKGLCDPKSIDTNRFTCPNETVYFSASVIWGVIGPRRVFNSQYPVLKYCFLIGVFIPIPFWAIDVLLPKYIEKLQAKADGAKSASVAFFKRIYSINRLFDANVAIMGILNFYAPYNMGYLTMGFYISIIFMWYIRNRYIAWFERYVYVLAAALSAGLALSIIIIFFSLQYKPKTLSWWGNNVPFAGQDGAGGPLMTLAPGEVFGPPPGSYYV